MSAHLSPTSATLVLHRPTPGVPRLLRTLWMQFNSAYAKALRAERTRGDLRRLDDRMLADIGVTRAQMRKEVGRAPWHLP